MVEFAYKKEKLRSGESILRPVAKVYLLRNRSEWVPEYFYIDSGADFSLIPYKFGRFLGLDEKTYDMRSIGGVGGLISMRISLHSWPLRVSIRFR